MTPGTTPQSGSQSAFAVVPAPVEPPRAGVPPTRPPGATPGRPDAPDQQLRIVADPATNSLIIFGTAQEFQNIKNILKDLDIMPRQVLMEVLVAEVTLTDDTSFGIEYEILKKSGVSIFGHTFPSQGGVRSGLLGAPSTTAGAITQFGSGISGVAGRSNAVRAFINALMSDSRVKILASPHVLATDNRPARIQVGTEEPIPTGIVQAAVGSATDLSTSTSIQFRNTGRIVTIIPQVNAKGLVNLQIKAEVSERGANVQIGAAGNTFPSFNTRDAETTAVVQDGETLVIGGIISDRVSRDRVGIPFLMNLPVLGRFFGTTTDNVQRTELVMLITPHVIRNVEEARSVTDEFKDKLSTVMREIERMRREAPRPPAKEIKPEEKPVEPETKQTPPVYQEQKSQYREPAKQPAPIHLPLYESNQPGQEAANGGQAHRVADGSGVEELKERRAGVWAVQVAAFAHERDARSLAKKLMDTGYDVYVMPAKVNDRTWHRVQIGRLTTREEAKELQEILRKNKSYAQAFLSYQQPME
jgi:type II secretory pathway component GspD/PulD (secretin)